MPHDVNGQPLNVGDKVNIPCVVKSISSGHEGDCNLSVESEYERKPNKTKETFTLNAATVVKVAVFLAIICLPSLAQAGPLCGLLRGAAHVATAPARVVGARSEARQEARASGDTRGPIRRLLFPNR